MPGVFLSYRRSDAGGWAGRLKDHLVFRYGPNRVWQDVDDLVLGADYIPQILENITTASSSTIYAYPSLDALFEGEAAGGKKSALPGPGQKPATERPTVRE